MRFIFAGGGTGGHIYPALAVAKEIMTIQPDAEILFVAGTRGIERRIVSDAGFSLKTIPVIGLPRKVSPAFVLFGWKLMVSVLISRGCLRNFKPSVVLATGGYVSGPPIIAAHTLGIPVVIQEQNSFPGITTRKLARYADIVFLGFHDADRYFRGDVETIVTGNPVRNEIGTGNHETAAALFGFNPSVKTVLVFGGSQGSRALNTVISGTAERLALKEIQVLWQTGQNEYATYKRFDGLCDGYIRVFPYLDDMVSAYAASDLVVSRAGAMTIAEITACGLPAVLIPLPTAAGNHQEHNARSLESAGAATMILERDLTSPVLENEIINIVTSADILSVKAESSKKLGNKDAAGVIARMLLERYGMN